MKWKKKKIKIVCFIAVIFLLLCAALIIPNVSYRKGEGFALNNNKLAMHLLHTYHSLRKIPDIAFLPYFFEESRLPLYNIRLERSDVRRLNAVLPENSMGGILLEENKTFIEGIFKTENYIEKAQIRYRGQVANHWNSFQKSYRIKFPDNSHLFNGMKSLDLVIPYDRGYYMEMLNEKRAEQFGLKTPGAYFVRLAINGKDSGVYIAFDHWSDEWIKRRNLPPDAAIFGAGDNPGKINLFSEEGKKIWVSYAGDGNFGKLYEFIDLVAEKDDETFKKEVGNILDLEKFYAWDIVNILAGSDHQSDFQNLILYFDPQSQKFEFIPWDVGIFESASEGFADNYFLLARRIFSFDEFRSTRDEMLEKYLAENNLKSDLNFYDEMAKTMKLEFYKDMAKLYNNFQFSNKVKEIRNLIGDNFEKARLVLEYDGNHYKNK